LNQHFKGAALITTTPIPLAELADNESGTIQFFESGRAIITRLASLGFTPGAEVDMAQNYGRGPLIVTVRGSRVALGRGEATKIFVLRGNDG
jgi:ferrous iron transport protein A